MAAAGPTATALRQKGCRGLFSQTGHPLFYAPARIWYILHRRSVIYNFPNNMHTFACGPYTEYVCLILLYCCARVRGENDFFSLSIHPSHCYNIIIPFVFVLRARMYIKKYCAEGNVLMKKKKYNVSTAFKNYIHTRAREWVIKQYNILYCVYMVTIYNIIMRSSWSPSTWPRQPVHLSGNNDRFVLTSSRDATAEAGVTAKGVPMVHIYGCGRWPNSDPRGDDG